MKPRTLGVLAAITGGVLAAAYFATRGEGGSSSAAQGAKADEFLFPGLRAGADSIVELRVSQGTKAARITREQGKNEWRVATLGGYPANGERVRDTVRALVEARIIERKTARKESHASIGLEDPAGESARSVLVEAIGADGKALARLVLGDVAPSASTRFDPSAMQRFVRRADEDQSYLVGGRFPADPSSTAWVSRSIGEIPGSRVREVRIARAGDEGVVASRADASAELAIQDVPTGRSIKDPTAVPRLAQALAFLTLEDVKPASESATLGDFDGGTVFEAITFDHLMVRARVLKVGEEYWTRLEAMVEPEPAAATATGDQGAVSAPSANAEVSIDDVAPAEQAKAGAPRDPAKVAAAAAEAEKLNAGWSGWVFRLASSKGEQLTATLDDFLTPSPIQGPEPLAPAPEEAAPASPAPIPAVAPDAPAEGVDPAKQLFPDSRP